MVSLLVDDAAAGVELAWRMLEALVGTSSCSRKRIEELVAARRRRGDEAA